MNNLKIFNSEEFGQIRTVQLNNETYFVGKDVAEALKYNEPHKAIQRHVEEDDRIKNIPSQTPLVERKTHGLFRSLAYML